MHVHTLMCLLYFADIYARISNAGSVGDKFIADSRGESWVGIAFHFTNTII